jgi:hypothetical protein
VKRVIVMAALVVLGGCKQKPKDDVEPSVAAPVAAATATATAVAEPAPAPPDTIPPPVQPMAVPVAAAPKGSAKAEPAKGEAPKADSLAACCAALHKEATESTKDKGLYQTAATSCDAIAKLVSTGTTKKSAALTQLRANLRGNKLPAGCE